MAALESSSQLTPRHDDGDRLPWRQRTANIERAGGGGATLDVKAAFTTTESQATHDHS